jgi:hypothetical protein
MAKTMDIHSKSGTGGGNCGGRVMYMVVA